MKKEILKDAEALGIVAGKTTAELIKKAIKEKGKASIILATGASQFETLKQLIKEEGIDWSVVTMFHLDEYIGLPVTHKASFRKYLTERFVTKMPPLQNVFLINGETDPVKECERLNTIIAAHPVDVALVGIGENGHLAFNDPPADFDIDQPYIIVNLDEPCRLQQLNEGWFNSLAEVPPRPSACLSNKS
ncbi:MAG: 6-phosphogluconolactonase [Agriterribacter sp.]